MAKARKAPRMGRPLKREGQVQDKQLQMRVSKEFLALVDEWRRQQPVIPSRTEAVRRMVEAAAVRAKRK
jgi:hypothetical protein